MTTKVIKKDTEKTVQKKTVLSVKERNKAIRELSEEVNRKAHLRFMEDLILKRK